MKPEELIEACPLVYHMAWEGAWPSIQRHGLLSTRALLDLFGITGARRDALLSAHRPEAQQVTHPAHGIATIRDQKPMSDSGLARALQGITPVEWYELLNARVFFWATEQRLATLMAARAYRDKRQTVLTVDTAELVRRHGERIELTTMNTGCTTPFAHPRDRRSFTPLSAFDYSASKRARGSARAIAEVAVLGGVPDLPEFVVRVEHRGGGLPTEVLFERGS